MTHILRRFTVLSFLVIPLVLGTPDAYSAKKQSDTRSTLRSARAADTTKSVKLPNGDAVRRDRKLHVSPDVQVTPTPRVPQTISNGRRPAGESGLRTSAAAIENNWISINHGGATEVASGNLRMGISIAQPVAGYVESGPYQLGLGYWYGAAASGGAGPGACDNQLDYDGSNLLDNVDLNWLIDVLFFNAPNLQDPNCPTFLMDFDCSGLADNLDLNWMIDYLFFNGPQPCQPCDCNSFPDDCPAFP